MAGARAISLSIDPPLPIRMPFLAGSLHQHRGQHGGCRLPHLSNDPLHLHSHRMGHLLARCGLEHLLANQLGPAAAARLASLTVSLGIEEVGAERAAGGQGA